MIHFALGVSRQHAEPIVYIVGRHKAGRGRRRRKSMRIPMGLFALAAAIVMGPLSSGAANPVAKSIKKSVFGKTPDGKEIELYVLTNRNGLEAAVTNFGGI